MTIGFKVGTLCRPPEFLQTKLIKPCLYGVGFVHRGKVVVEQKKPSINCCHRVGIAQLSNMSVYAVVITVQVNNLEISLHTFGHII